MEIFLYIFLGILLLVLVFTVGIMFYVFIKIINEILKG